MGSTALWGNTVHPNTRKSIQLIEIAECSQVAPYHHKPIWKVKSSTHCQCFLKLNHSYFKMSHCAFNGISDSYRQCKVASKVPKSAVCYVRHTFESHFVFLLVHFFLLSYAVEQIFWKLVTFR